MKPKRLSLFPNLPPSKEHIPILSRRTDSGPNRNNLFSTILIRERYQHVLVSFQNDIGTFVLSFLTFPPTVAYNNIASWDSSLRWKDWVKGGMTVLVTLRVRFGLAWGPPCGHVTQDRSLVPTHTCHQTLGRTHTIHWLGPRIYKHTARTSQSV